MSQAVVEARALRHSYGAGAPPALRGLELRLGAGEIYGLVGSDGAGKTTTMRILAGMIAASAGEVRVLGRSPLGADPRLRAAIGYMPQHYSLYGDLSVEENLRFFSRMFCQPRAVYAERRQRLLQITRLGPFTDRRADALSGGMYKKLALACALLPRPRVLLLDEPTNGVDPVSRRELWALLFELVADEMAILVSTAYMDEADRCHRVGLMHRGELLLQGEPRQLLQRFPHRVLAVDGGDPQRVDALLAQHPEVLAVAATAARTKAVVRGGAAGDAGAAPPTLAGALEALGATCRPVAATFEDLFLAHTARREPR